MAEKQRGDEEEIQQAKDGAENMEVEEFKNKKAVESIEDPKVKEDIQVISNKIGPGALNAIKFTDEVEETEPEEEAANDDEEKISPDEKVKQILKDHPEETLESARKLVAFEIFNAKLQKSLDKKRKELSSKSPAYSEIFKEADLNDHFINMQIKGDGNNISKPFEDFNTRDLKNSQKIIKMHESNKLKTENFFRLLAINKDSEELQIYILAHLAKAKEIDLPNATPEQLKTLFTAMNDRIDVASAQNSEYMKNSKEKKTLIDSDNLATQKKKLRLIDEQYSAGDLNMSEYLRQKREIANSIGQKGVQQKLSSMIAVFGNHPLREKWANEKKIKAQIKNEAIKAWVVNGIIGTIATAKRVTGTSLMSIVKYPFFGTLKILASVIGQGDKVQIGKMAKEDWDHVTQPIRDTYKEGKNTIEKAKASVTEAEEKRKAEKISDIRKRVQMVKALKSYNDIGPITVNANEANFLNDLKKSSEGIKKVKEGQVIDLPQFIESLNKKAA